MSEVIHELEQRLYEMEMDGDTDSPLYDRYCEQLDRLYEDMEGGDY